jgi:hypothetical protein
MLRATQHGENSEGQCSGADRDEQGAVKFGDERAVGVARFFLAGFDGIANGAHAVFESAECLDKARHHALRLLRRPWKAVATISSALLM